MTNSWLPKDGAIFVLLHANGLINLLPEEVLGHISKVIGFNCFHIRMASVSSIIVLQLIFYFLACLDEESYPVRSGFVSSSKGVKGSVKSQLSQGNDRGNLQSEQSSLAMETNSAVAPSAGVVDSDMEASISQNTSSTVPTRSVFGEEGDNIESVGQTQCETNLTNLDGCVADDSQSEDNDLYLSECRVLLTGFEAPEMRRLVNMVRRGGGSRHVQFNDKLTHIVVGNPSET